MPTDIEALNALATILFDRVWSVAWQWTVLVLAVAVPAQWLLRSHTPALRYWVWQIVLMKLLLMPLWTYALPVAWLPTAWLPARPAASVAPPAALPPLPPVETERSAELPAIADQPFEIAPDVAPVPEMAPLRPRLSWQAWLAVGWFGVVLLQVGRLLRQHGRLARVLRAARPAEGQLIAAVGEAAILLHLKSPPRVLTTDQNISPFVCGAWRPVLMLPEALAESLNPLQLQQVLLHELAHIRRHDLVWGWIPELVRVVWFFHPVVHWVGYRLRLERELACDQLAMALSGKDAAGYADTLVHVASHASQPTLPGPILAIARHGNEMSNEVVRFTSSHRD